VWVRDSMPIYHDCNVQVLDISIDSRFAVIKSKQYANLDFPLLSDFNKTASTADDLLYETFPIFEIKGAAKELRL
jgi:glutaredoxin-dependent peroxiredoxin